MARQFNRAWMTVSGTPGTGTITLGASVSDAYLTLAEAGVANGNVCAYVLEDGNDFEIGIGTYTSSGTTFSRDTVTVSKEGGTSGTSKITASSSSTIFLCPRASDIAGEKLSWTPVLTCATPGNLSVAYSVQLGWYTVKGREVTAHFNIITSTWTHTTASGSIMITGLPHTSENVASQKHIGPVTYQGFTKANYFSMLADVANNASQIVLDVAGTGQSIQVAAVTDFPTGGTVVLQGHVTYVMA